MENLPDEIIADILDYLPPSSVLSVQRVCRSLLKIARDSSLWRYKCYEKAPSATSKQANNPNAISLLGSVLGGLSLDDSKNTADAESQQPRAAVSKISKRARDVADWDCSDPRERIDWYSEYIGRHAPLSTEWLNVTDGLESRGMAIFDDSQKVLSPMEDGSIRIWDLHSAVNGRRSFHELGRSQPALLFQDHSSGSGPSTLRSNHSLGTAVDNTVVDTTLLRAYIAVEDTLNEVDLSTLQVVSQQKYAWNITALSQEANQEIPLMIGTSFSLQMHDTRQPPKPVAGGYSGIDATTEDDKMVFLPNYSKEWARRSPNSISPNNEYEYGHVRYSPSPPRSDLSRYARVEPGPQSILHHGPNEVVVAGRMPSILFYDKRTFPHLQSVIHSGARLSALTSLPVPPCGASKSSLAEATLIACGEYHGRGSLEIYELPPRSRRDRKTSELGTPELSQPPSDVEEMSLSPCNDGNGPNYHSYVNRQAASSAKLLSVATQGARIVFSDGEGALKWLERDGRGLARRWNINEYSYTPYGASLSGEQVVRKMITLPEPISERGIQGDGDLLVWTGEKLGIVTSKVKWDIGHDELVKEFEEKMNLNDNHGDGSLNQQKQEEEYFKAMRLALERQADERRWMSRFGVKR